MSHWEPTQGQSSDWQTPAYIFIALGCTFDLDVAAPLRGPLHVPAKAWISENSLTTEWRGFVWMNPPFGARNGLMPWLYKFGAHRNGIALTPDRTSAPWWHCAAIMSDAMLLVAGKVAFIRPDGSKGVGPSTGTTLFAIGDRGCAALERAAGVGLGIVVRL